MKPKIRQARKDRARAFGDLLSKGIWGVCDHLGRFVQRVEADLLKEVEALGYEVSSSTINYWRRGNIPADSHIVELIVRYCLKNNPYLELRWATDFLDAAGYSDQQRATFLGELFQSQTPHALVPESLVASVLHQHDQAVSSFTVLLPRRPKVQGQAKLLQQLRHALTDTGNAIVSLSGMPGIGKTALAVECAYQLAEDPTTRLHYPDGFFFFSCVDQHEQVGFLNVARQILTLVSHSNLPLDHAPDQWLTHQLRLVGAGSRALIILDAVPADFPVQALELLTQRVRSDAGGITGCSLLVTSRTSTMPGFIDKQLKVDPLPNTVAADLLRGLLDRSLSEQDERLVQHLSATVGGNPLGLEWIAQAARLGLALSFLDEFLSTAVDSLLGEEHQLHGRFRQAIAELPVELQNRFARLAALGTAPFTVAEAAPLVVWPELIWDASEMLEPMPDAETGSALESVLRQEPAPNISGIALHTIRANLLRLASSSIITPVLTGNAQQFQMPPLFHAVAADLARQHFREAIELAERYPENIPQDHQLQILQALAYAWSGQDMVHVLELAASLYWAVAYLPAANGERILRWGIKASRELHDRYSLVRFLTRLGKLRFYRGDMTFAEQVWEESVTLSQSQLRSAASERVGKLLLPLSNLTLIPGVQEAYEPALSSVNRLLRASQAAGAVEMIADAHMKQAFYARLLGNWDSAFRSVEQSTALAYAGAESLLHQSERDLEIARITGDFEKADDLFVQLLRVIRDPMPRADALYDQAKFALAQLRLEDARHYSQQSLEMALEAAAPVTTAQSRMLLMQLL